MAARLHSAENRRLPCAIDAGAPSTRVFSYLIALIASYPGDPSFLLLFSSPLCFSLSHSFSHSAALCQQLLDKCSQNESLISRPGVTEQVNSLGNKMGRLNSPLSRINQWLHLSAQTHVQFSLSFKISEQGSLLWFMYMLSPWSSH